MCSSRTRKPVPFIENLKAEMPLGRKLSLLRRNV